MDIWTKTHACSSIQYVDNVIMAEKYVTNDATPDNGHVAQKNK